MLLIELEAHHSVFSHTAGEKQVISTIYNALAN